MAKPGDWHTKPLPDQYVVIEYGRQFSKEEMSKIKQGIVPQEMEDKWFIYYTDHDSCLYIHRSWTGFTVYIVRFNEQDDGGALAVDFRANRDPEQYKETKNERDKEMLTFIIDSFFLGRFPPLPSID